MKNKKKINPLFIALGVTVTVIIALGYVKYALKSGSSKHEPVVSQQTKLENAKLGPEVTGLDFKSFMSANDCQKLNHLCEDAGLTGAKEGVKILEDNLIVFVDLDKFPMEGTHENFRNSGEREKQAMILSRYGTHPDILDAAFDSKAKRLLVVGFSNLDEIVSLRSLLNVNYQEVPELDYDVQENLFSEVYFAGRFNLYNRYIKKSLQINLL